MIPGRYWPCFSSCHRRGSTLRSALKSTRLATHSTPGPRGRCVLLTRQFALAGGQSSPLPTPYLVARQTGKHDCRHDSRAKGAREERSRARDLPALYSQMVRSLETGRPMTGLGVVDRTNVTAAQATAQRVHSDGFFYARLGYSGIFGDRVYGTPSFGFGYRAELDSMAIDVSFLNTQMGSSSYYSSGASSSSLLKLSGLYLLNRESNSTPYFGGGLSWGSTNVSASQSLPLRPRACRRAPPRTTPPVDTAADFTAN